MNKNQGFTLIEIMIVVAIIGILAAIAIPNYNQYILRSYRVDARNTLQEVANRLQQNYSINKSYTCLDKACSKTINNDTIKSWGLDYSPNNQNKRYSITIETPDASDTQSGSYILKATPQPVQSKDACGSFILTQTNIQTIILPNGNQIGSRSAEALNCWGK